VLGIDLDAEAVNTDRRPWDDHKSEGFENQNTSIRARKVLLRASRGHREFSEVIGLSSEA
jgi:hypothetical protein